MPIGEIILSAIITVLFEKLTSSELLSFARRQGVHKEIEKWHDMLLKIKYMLSDAEDQQIKNKAAQLWLEELQDLAYDLDDVVDEFATEQIKLKLDGLVSLQHSPIKVKVKAFLSGCCTSVGCLSPSSFMFNSNMMSKITEISTRMELIIRQIRDLNLDHISSDNKITNQRTPTTSLIHVSKICGRGKDMNEIIKLLFKDGELDQENDRVGVISIVGMGGIGKTTLTQAVYNDDNVKEHFPMRAWVCVSEEFDILRVTKGILESVTSTSCSFNNLDQVQVELKKSLAGKKFLIVLDDVWHKDYNDWNVVKSPFYDALHGSKVLVTTRDENVASVMRSSKHQHHLLQRLSFGDCLSVFAQHAFVDKNMNMDSKLLEIGQKIVDRCKGLPLSARVLGGLLQCKESESEWIDVLNSEVWEKDNEILPSLRLSYHHLPSHLKPCFAYCSIIPKDYEFSKEDLVYLWMAAGLVQQGREKKQLEEIGSDYFHELLSRTFFQPSGIEGNSKSFLMHDLINDLAKVVSGDLCFKLEDKAEDREKSINYGRARHSSLLQGEFDRIQKFECFFEAKHLRTLVSFPGKYLQYNKFCLANNVPSILFPKLRLLRALSLRKYNISELPGSIGDMKHLRYLDFSFTYIETLPDWVQKLYNLQTLILRECRSLWKLPRNMGNLINLRRFDVTGSPQLTEMPLGIGKMENLRMLSNFIVTKDNGSRIRELGKLRQIGETLCISGLQNVTDPMDGQESCLIEKHNLNKLGLIYNATPDKIPNEEVQLEVLHMLQPHKNLKELRIWGYHGMRFPDWFENPICINMVQIVIKDCTNCKVLPALGQLKSLKKLYIQGMSGVKLVGPEFYGQACPQPFPELVTLIFKDMSEWEDWFDIGVDDETKPFSHVNQLKLINCPKLVRKLPSNLPKLQRLDIIACERLMAELDHLVYPSLTVLFVDGVKLPFGPPMLKKMYNTQKSRCLSSLIVKSVSMPDSLCNTSISSQLPNSVANLALDSIQKLAYLPKWLTLNLKYLKQMSIYNCNVLKTLLDNIDGEVMQLQYQLPMLQRLRVISCPLLISFFPEEGDKMNGETKGNHENEGVQSFMVRLESLVIKKCAKLEKLPRTLYMVKCLVELELWDCDNLVSLPETGFPSTLRTLHICGCKSLMSPLPCWNSENNLETLDVSHCPSLTSLFASYCSSSSINMKTSGIPSSLKYLSIMDCRRLEALVLGEDDTRIHCPSLEVLSISNCGRLKYLPHTLHHNSLEKLKTLTLEAFEDLQDLSGGWLLSLTNLTCISIGGCIRGNVEYSGNGVYGFTYDITKDISVSKGRKEGHMRLFSNIAKEAGFLTNLTTLNLEDIMIGVHPSEWGLHRIRSLRELQIGGQIRVAPGEEVVKVYVFPLDGMLLPTSLAKLVIEGFPELERLSSKGFESLGSLRELRIDNCWKLGYLPKSGFPDTLMQLDIINSPLLDKKCLKGKGKYWSIISCIPWVCINH